MEPDLKPALFAALDLLDRRGLRWCVIGGLALSHWKVIRATDDVDIKVLVPRLNYLEVRDWVRGEYPGNPRSHFPDNPLIFAVLIHSVIVDFLLTTPGYDEAVVERAVESELFGREVRVCTAEDLVVQKIVAGRSNDMRDIEMLLKVRRDELDYNYIEYWLKQFDDVLVEMELLKKFTKMRRTAGNG